MGKLKNWAMPLAVCAATLGATDSPADANDVLAHWSFDDASGTTVVDSVRPGQPGTIIDTNGTLNAPGVFNAGGSASTGGIYLSSAGEGVRVPRIDMQSTSFTIAAWIDPDSLDNQSQIFGDWSNPWQFRFFLNNLDAANPGKLGMNIRKNDPTTISDLVHLSSDAVIDTVDGFQHVAATWDRATKTASLYLNGTLLTSQQTSSSILDTRDGNHADYDIGHKQDGGGEFDGGMDELWVLNRSMSSVELQELMRTNEARRVRRVDLADIVGGGDGSGTGTANGIDAATGQIGTGFHGINNPASPGDYSSVAYGAVDGVFVPNGDIGAQQISSTGLTFDFTAGNGEGSYNSWYNGSNIDDPSGMDGLPDFTDGPAEHSLLSAHAQKGITFDLDLLEADGEAYRFTTWVGDSAAKLGGEIAFYVLVDGVERAFGSAIIDDAQFLEIDLNPDDRFLTLVTMNSNGTNNSDHSFFGDPFVYVEMTAVPEPSSLAVLGLGMFVVARRRR